MECPSTLFDTRKADAKMPSDTVGAEIGPVVPAIATTEGHRLPPAQCIENDGLAIVRINERNTREANCTHNVSPAAVSRPFEESTSLLAEAAFDQLSVHRAALTAPADPFVGHRRLCQSATFGVDADATGRAAQEDRRGDIMPVRAKQRFRQHNGRPFRWLIR